MKGISLVTPEHTRRHQANTSTAKYACGFSRQKRFFPPNPEYTFFNIDASKPSISKTKANSLKLPLGYPSVSAQILPKL